MDRIFKLPDFGSDDLNITARLNYYLAAGLILFNSIFITIVPFLAPDLTRRFATIAGFVILISVVIMVLIQHNRLRAAGITLVINLWVTVTVGAITGGSLSAPIALGYIIVIMAGGLVSRRMTNFITTGVCILTVILIAAAQSNGILPAPVRYPPIARASVYIFFFVLASYLQTINALNTSELLKKTQKSEIRYRSLLENIPATTYIHSVGTEAATEYVSPQVERLLGYPRNAFMDDSFFWMKILHPDDIIFVQQQNRRAAETLEPFSMEYRVLAKDKRVVWLKDEAVLV